jgi:hypothetical protein
MHLSYPLDLNMEEIIHKRKKIHPISGCQLLAGHDKEPIEAL